MQNIIHYPRLDTVLMIENTIRKAKEFPSLRQFWQALPKQVMYQTFKITTSYLVASNKIMICKDGAVIWIFADTEKKQAMMQSKKEYS